MAKLGPLPVGDREHVVDDILEIQLGAPESLGPACNLVHVLRIERPGIEWPLLAGRFMGSTVEAHVRWIS